MARQEEEITEDETETPDEKPQASASSPTMLWLQEHWEGWLKPVGTLVLCLVAYFLYKLDLVGEGLAGVGAVLAILLGVMASTAAPAWPLVRAPWQRALFGVVIVAGLIGTGYPSLRASWSPKAAAEVRLTVATPSATVKLPGDGPWELAVGGTFKNPGGEAEVGYTIKATVGSASEEVAGAIERKLVRLRTSRRGGSSTTVQERVENVHRLKTVRGNEMKLEAEGVDEQLADGLLVDVRPAGPSPILFLILAGLAVVGAVALDGRLTDIKGKAKSYLAVGVGLCLAFSLFFPDVATPHSVVRPAVDALMKSLLGAGLGWLLGVFARLAMFPKIAKKARR